MPYNQTVNSSQTTRHEQGSRLYFNSFHKFCGPCCVCTEVLWDRRLRLALSGAVNTSRSKGSMKPSNQSQTCWILGDEREQGEVNFGGVRQLAEEEIFTDMLLNITRNTSNYVDTLTASCQAKSI